jgi:hypothetical protein
VNVASVYSSAASYGGELLDGFEFHDQGSLKVAFAASFLVVDKHKKSLGVAWRSWRLGGKDACRPRVSASSRRAGVDG